MLRQKLLWCVITIIVAGAISEAAATLRIVPIVRDQSVVVSVELADAYTDEVRQAIASGLRTMREADIENRGFHGSCFQNLAGFLNTVGLDTSVPAEAEEMSGGLPDGRLIVQQKNRRHLRAIRQCLVWHQVQRLNQGKCQRV